MSELVEKAEKISGSLLKATSLLLLSLIIALIGISILSRTSIMGFRSAVVLNGSLLAYMEPGDVVVSRSIPTWLIGTRDIILVRDSKDPTQIMPHRVMASRFEEGLEYFYTQDDANHMVDMQRVRQDEVIGTTFLRIPRVGLVIDAIKKPEGFLIFIVVPAVYLLFSEFLHIYQLLKTSKEWQYDSDLQGLLKSV